MLAIQKVRGTIPSPLTYTVKEIVMFIHYPLHRVRFPLACPHAKRS
jgi:hypothetical protein